MSDNNQRGDFYSGLPWVHVTPQQARGLPQGQLGVILWIIAAYFVIIAAFKFGYAIYLGAGITVAVLNGIWPMLAGIGLALRVPWSTVMVMISSSLTIYALVRGMESYNSVIVLFELIANVGILFYLIDGDRPNLIYRHRYRKYSVDSEPIDDEATKSDDA